MKSESSDEFGTFRILDSNKYAVVSKFRGEVFVHIREYETNPITNKLYQSKRGVSFIPSTFATFVLNLDEIDRNVRALNSDKQFEYKVHLGKGVFCTVNAGHNFVNLRRYFLLNGQLQPTKNGICLKPIEWYCLKGYIESIKSSAPELESAVPCFFLTDHSNQESASNCSICHPFGFDASYA